MQSLISFEVRCGYFSKAYQGAWSKYNQQTSSCIKISAPFKKGGLWSAYIISKI
jgi:hypothetical protein